MSRALGRIAPESNPKLARNRNCVRIVIQPVESEKRSITPAAASRIDRGHRLIHASPQAIFAALTSAEAIAAWRPPAGMHAIIDRFEPCEGGAFRMAFIYDAPGEGVAGKSSADADWFHGTFRTIAPDRIVEAVEFETDDPAFAGTMVVTTRFSPVPEGTMVDVACEQVPPGISAEDHAAGIASSLANLAAYVEDAA